LIRCAKFGADFDRGRASKRRGKLARDGVDFCGGRLLRFLATGEKRGKQRRD
jgi:hypothetical protein